MKNKTLSTKDIAIMGVIFGTLLTVVAILGWSHICWYWANIVPIFIGGFFTTCLTYGIIFYISSAWATGNIIARKISGKRKGQQAETTGFLGSYMNIS